MLVMNELVFVVAVGSCNVDFAVGAAPAGRDVDELWYEVTSWQ
jgi:hypothetical protein